MAFSRKLFGTYRTPRFRYGDKVIDLVRGEVEIVGITEGKIPWPIGKRGRVATMVLFDCLIDAVKHECGRSVAEWWGVCPYVVWKWRRALGVPHSNEGMRKLRLGHYNKLKRARAGQKKQGKRTSAKGSQG